jgi:hypothetical protein
LQLKFYLKFKNKEDLIFTEHGHRFFDLKRSGTADEVLFQNQAGTVILWPIPELELNANPTTTKHRLLKL